MKRLDIKREFPKARRQWQGILDRRCAALSSSVAEINQRFSSENYEINSNKIGRKRAI